MDLSELIRTLDLKFQHQFPGLPIFCLNRAGHGKTKPHMTNNLQSLYPCLPKILSTAQYLPHIDADVRAVALA